ncbi:phosphoribosyltransferase [Spirillospora sp. NPDC127200]
MSGGPESLAAHLTRLLGTDHRGEALAALRLVHRQAGGRPDFVEDFADRATARLLHACGPLREEVVAECAAELASCWGTGPTPVELVWKADPHQAEPVPRIPQQDVERRVAELGRELSADYAGDEPVLVGVLESAGPLTRGLAAAMKVPADLDWIKVSAYGSGAAADGTLRVTRETSADLTGRHVVLVDDAIATGLTLSRVREHVLDQGAASVRACVLLRAAGYTMRSVRADYVGFDIDWAWPVGYGIDYRGRFRDFPGVGQLRLVPAPAGD